MQIISQAVKSHNEGNTYCANVVSAILQELQTIVMHTQTPTSNIQV